LDHGGTFSIQITDSGTGIPKEFHERIMEPFFSTKASQGAGLGLTIARALAQSHHGRLYLNTNSEHTQFVLTLPKMQHTVPKLFAA
jgi:signal transduction histidine kinase